MTPLGLLAAHTGPDPRLSLALGNALPSASPLEWRWQVRSCSHFHIPFLALELLRLLESGLWGRAEEAKHTYLRLLNK